MIMASVHYPGVMRVLKETEKTGLGRFVEIPETTAISTMDQIVEEIGDGTLLLGGYHEAYEYFLQGTAESSQPLVKNVGVLWTSPPLQSELVPTEFFYLSLIKKHLDSGHLKFVWFGSREWINRLKWDNVFYAPYPVSLPELEKVEPLNGDHVGMFGPLHGRKNVLAQFQAAKELDTTLHVTAPRPEYDVLAAMLDLKLERHPWPEWSDYLKLVAQMKAGLQVSMKGAESFSYVTFDCLSQGVPCLSSVDWAPSDLKVENPLDVDEIVYKLRSILQNPPLPGATRAFAEYQARVQVESFKKAVQTHFGPGVS